VFAEIALTSSHSVWVPILPVLDDWRRVGNGTAFTQWKGAGEEPASLLREPDSAREHYALAINYALNVATGYVTRHVDENTLLVPQGDHQAAPLVTGEGANRDVIVHVISGNPELLAPFLAAKDSGRGFPGFQPNGVYNQIWVVLAPAWRAFALSCSENSAACPFSPKWPPQRLLNVKGNRGSAANQQLSGGIGRPGACASGLFLFGTYTVPRNRLNSFLLH